MIPRRGESGLMTLEWLLVVAAVAGIAAVAAYIVQRVVDEEVDVADDPTVLVLDAEIAAAFVAEEAYEQALRQGAANPLFDHRDSAFLAPFRARCQDLADDDRFGDVVLTGILRDAESADGNPYRCDLTFRNLAES